MTVAPHTGQIVESPSPGPATFVWRSEEDTAAWAQHSQNTHRVKAAFLVGPGDPEREELQAPLKSWWPVVMDKLPFPAELLGSRNDPYCTFERAQQFASAWGADFVDCGNAGHLNADSGLGDWPEGIARLHALMARAG